MGTIADNFEDLNPPITYRHLHSKSLGIRDPLRVIALCDCDAFYAACEQVRLGLDPSKPLVVQQWEAMIAVNYPARKFGISRMDKVVDAKKRCPQLITVHVATYKEGDKEPQYWDKPDTTTHKVSLDLYRRESTKVVELFKANLPGAEVEKASIDECFIDLTPCVRELILEQYPHLADVPPDAPNGADTPLPPPPRIIWDDLGNLIPIRPAKPQDEDQEAGPSRSNNEDDHGSTWHDVALSIGARLMMHTREDIYKQLGYTTSAGLARNKFLAKLTASYKKPYAQTILRNAAIPEYLCPMPFQKIRFLGGKLGEALAEEYDAKDVGSLLSVSLEEMQRKFGESSIWVYELLRGVDRSEVKEKSAHSKSMLASKNLRVPVTKPSQGPHWLRVLAAELAHRLKESRKTSPGLWPKSLTLHVSTGYKNRRSKQAVFPFSRTISVDLIAAQGDKLWKELVGTDETYKGPPMKITHVGLSFHGVETMEVGQQMIEGFLKGDSKQKGSGLKRGAEDMDDVFEILDDGHDEADEDVVAGPSSKSPTKPRPKSFLCDQCGKQIPIQSRESGDEYDVDEVLRAAKMEHDDYHFAQNLVRSENCIVVPAVKKAKTANERSNGKGKGKKEQPVEGIAKYFKKGSSS